MTDVQEYNSGRLVHWVCNRPRFGTILGHSVLAAGALLIGVVAYLDWKPQSDDNPFVVLLLVWVMAGICHDFKRFWPACMISAAGSAVGYVILAFLLTPDPLGNDMFGAGILELGVVGFLFSMIMGHPCCHLSPHS
jgi:hypothetical protein